MQKGRGEIPRLVEAAVPKYSNLFGAAESHAVLEVAHDRPHLAVRLVAGRPVVYGVLEVAVGYLRSLLHEHEAEDVVRNLATEEVVRIGRPLDVGDGVLYGLALRRLDVAVALHDGVVVFEQSFEVALDAGA